MHPVLHTLLVLAGRRLCSSVCPASSEEPLGVPSLGLLLLAPVVGLFSLMVGM